MKNTNKLLITSLLAAGLVGGVALASNSASAGDSGSSGGINVSSSNGSVSGVLNSTVGSGNTGDGGSAGSGSLF